MPLRSDVFRSSQAPGALETSMQCSTYEVRELVKLPWQPVSLIASELGFREDFEAWPWPMQEIESAFEEVSANASAVVREHCVLLESERSLHVEGGSPNAFEGLQRKKPKQKSADSSREGVCGGRGKGLGSQDGGGGGRVYALWDHR
eukprot:scaffold576_cov260-Pinguiococcus_pyrenoidosus.AAC.18